MYEELKARMRSYLPLGDGSLWAESSKDIARSIDAIEQLERQLAERDAEIAKLIQAVADHVTVRSEQYAEIAKYRDAPVVAYLDKDGIVWKDIEQVVEGDKPLVVKPGE